MPQAVHALFVALRWDCEHLREQEDLVELYDSEQKVHFDAMFCAMFARQAAAELTEVTP